jgi:limonene-1,2-epoxide hydrolase
MNEPTRQQRQIEVFRTMARAWHEQQWRTCADQFAPDGVLHSVMLEPVVGREAIYDRISKLGGSHKRVTLHIHRIGVVGGALFVERTDEIVIDGKRGECPAVGVLEFEGDRIARWRDYYDRNQLARAAGHVLESAAH